MATNVAVVNTSRGELSRKLSINGLSVRTDAMSVLECELKHGSPPYSSVDNFIEALLQVILDIPTEGYLVDVEIAQQAVHILRQKRSIQANDHTRQMIIRNVTEDECHSGLGGTTLTNFKHHYTVLLKSLKKQAVFESGQFRLTTVDELNTYDSSLEWKCIVFGLIRKDPSKLMQYLLEDVTGKIPVTFSSEVTNYREWCMVENSIYLVEGIYEGEHDSFVVTSLGLPPPMLHLFPSIMVQEVEVASKHDQMVIMVADIHLDDLSTMDAFKFLLTGYNSVQDVPELFVLMGNFTSIPVDRFTFKEHMKNLVKLISTFKRLSGKARFVFVPGPNDPVSSNQLWVRNQFDADHFPTTTTRLPNYHLATNPFHLQVEGRNLTVMAQPIMAGVLKNVIHSKQRLNQANPWKNEPSLFDKFLCSLGRVWFCSAHLTSGLNRNFIDSLSLLPSLPDLVVVADSELNRHHSCRPYDKQSQVQLATMASFSRGHFQFLVYYVNEARLEESQISL